MVVSKPIFGMPGIADASYDSVDQYFPKRRPFLMQVFVRDNDMNSALRVLKKKMQREGTFREMKRRRAYEKPSERRVREQAEAVRRYRKAMRKRMEREGY
jgi:small subunit ribosomal protein S21